VVVLVLDRAITELEVAVLVDCLLEHLQPHLEFHIQLLSVEAELVELLVVLILE